MAEKRTALGQSISGHGTNNLVADDCEPAVNMDGGESSKGAKQAIKSKLGALKSNLKGGKRSPAEAAASKVKKFKNMKEPAETGEEAKKKPEGKKGKKEKKASVPEGGDGKKSSSKTSSFVKKLNLGKYIGSPSGMRRTESAKSMTAGETESDTQSDVYSSASSSLASTSVKRQTPEGDDGPRLSASASEINIGDGGGGGGGGEERAEGETSAARVLEDGPRDSTLLKGAQSVSATAPFAISPPKNADGSEERAPNRRKLVPWTDDSIQRGFMDDQSKEIRRHSAGDEIAGDTSAGTDEERHSAHQLPGIEEDKTESADDLETNKNKPAEDINEAAAAKKAMPAFGDLIIDAAGSTSNLTQPGLERKEHLYKILVIGELGTGKTSIIKRYVHQFFSQHYRATIGVDFALKVLNWDANNIIRLQLWDIAGQERFGNMTRVYYKDAVGAFIVFDVTRLATFDAVIKWKQDLDSKVQLPDGSPIPCVLLGNKCDQQKEGIINTPSRMDEYCKERGFSGWFETSAKENINIEEAAKFLVNKILLNDTLLHSNETNKDNERIAVDGKATTNGQKSDSKSCC